jgi:hypothetical protein
MKIYTLIHFDEEDKTVWCKSFTSKEAAIELAKKRFELHEDAVHELELTGETSWEMYNDGMFHGRLSLNESELV